MKNFLTIRIQVKQLKLLQYLVAATVTFLFTHPATAFELSSLLKSLQAPQGLAINQKGELNASTPRWRMESNDASTTIYRYSRLNPSEPVKESSVVLTKDASSGSSLASFILHSENDSEESAYVGFINDKVSSFTKCQSKGKHTQRVCQTVTAKLCEDLKSHRALSSTVLDEVQSTEIHALATILTLRGEDHQLENVSQTGNRLGIASKSQLTRTRLAENDKPTLNEALSLCQHRF